MTSWGFDPVGSPWLATSLAILLLSALVVGPAGKRLARGRRTVLFALRTATALLLIVALWRPSLVATEIRKIPGSLVMLLDSSRSMQVNDSLANQSRWEALQSVLSSVSDRLAKLAETWDLKFYRFDETIEAVSLVDGKVDLPEQPEGPQTAIGASMDEVLRREEGRRVVAVLLLGDGAQRAFAPRDLPPQAVARRLAIDEIPLYTVAFGKPALGLQSDLRIDDLLANDVVFAEAPMSVRATFGADGYANQTHRVQLLWETEDGTMEIVDTREVATTGNRRRQEVVLEHTPMTPGEYKITVHVESPEGELVTSNNSQSTFVTVRKGGVNILYLVGASRIGGGPGVEPRFVRSALAAHTDFNVQYDLLNYVKQRIDITATLAEDDYDVYLLGDVDTVALNKNSWQQIAADVGKGAGLAMLGGFHSFGPGGFRNSPLDVVLPVRMGRAERQNFGEPARQDMHIPGPIRLAPVAIGNRWHPIFQLDDEGVSSKRWLQLPPLDGINRIDRRNIKPNAQIIAQSADASRWPILVAGAWGDGRTMAFAGDTTWHWQMEGFGELHRRFWRQMILWLGQKDDSAGENVWVQLDARRYQRGSRIEFEIGVQDDERQPVVDASFDIQVVSPNGKTTTVKSARRGEKQIATFQETNLSGDYRIVIAASHEGRPLGSAQARFTVPDRDMELDQPAAEPTLLAALAGLTAESGGMGIAPEELPKLLDQLESRSAEFEEEIAKEKTLWDTWPMFLSLVALLSTEWYLRKRWGLV